MPDDAPYYKTLRVHPDVHKAVQDLLLELAGRDHRRYYVSEVIMLGTDLLRAKAEAEKKQAVSLPVMPAPSMEAHPGVMVHTATLEQQGLKEIEAAEVEAARKKDEAYQKAQDAKLMAATIPVRPAEVPAKVALEILTCVSCFRGVARHKWENKGCCPSCGSKKYKIRAPKGGK
jgi:formate dehydrogenase maturation protein FdhE